MDRFWYGFIAGVCVCAFFLIVAPSPAQASTDGINARNADGMTWELTKLAESYWAKHGVGVNPDGSKVCKQFQVFHVDGFEESGTIVGRGRACELHISTAYRMRNTVSKWHIARECYVTFHEVGHALGLNDYRYFKSGEAIYDRLTNQLTGGAPIVNAEGHLVGDWIDPHDETGLMSTHVSDAYMPTQCVRYARQKYKEHRIKLRQTRKHNR